jgi:hypothetical protein
MAQTKDLTFFGVLGTGIFLNADILAVGMCNIPLRQTIPKNSTSGFAMLIF